MMQYHSYFPEEGHRLPHDPIKAIIAPRPIGWFTTVDAQGRVNLAPYSFFNAFAASHPIILAFASEGKKDTASNIEATGEFVYNLATRPLAEAMNACSAPLPHGVNEMERAGLTPLPSTRVRPPRVAQSPVTMECRLLEMRPLRDLEGRELSNILILGQVVAVHIDEACLEHGLFDIANARTIARCGYQGDYAEVTETFQMLRPKG
jgi:flavin reductase (DIM6/NTAB) family NADH-FMN oxidoreductase RutF